MKLTIIRFLILTVLCSFVAAGCTSHRRVVVTEPVLTPTGEVVVMEAPPAPREEVMGRAPSTSMVWVQGYWSYTNRRWVWIPGHWASRPRPAAMWVPGHWDRTTRGWVWTAGHWE